MTKLSPTRQAGGSAQQSDKVGEQSRASKLHRTNLLVRAPLESRPNRPQFLINNQRQARLRDSDCCCLVVLSCLVVVLSGYQKVNKDD